jgi:hypothetical protein
MSDQAFAQKIMSSESGFNGRYEEEEALNSRFYALDPDSSYPMLKLSATWLRSLPNLKGLSPPKLEAAKAAVIAANPFYEERSRKDKAAQEASFFYWAPRKLCSDAGIEFRNLTAGGAVVAEGQRRFAWFMQTSDGLMAMAMFASSLFSGPKAKLFRVVGLDTKGQALAQVGISKEDYRDHVPRTY